MLGPLHLIYFSPTDTTRKIVEAIADGFSVAQINRYDVTLVSESTEESIEDGVAIFGVPVYAGRVPEVCLERLAGFTAADIPVILIALYGNREFEDALVELRDVAAGQGFQVVAAGAFIGEHSYSTPERPIAAGRPNAEDLHRAVKFGQQVAAKIARSDYDIPEIEGNVPYKERVQLGGVAPETDHEKCTLCGTCAEVCPMGIVTLSDRVKTNATNCIMCCACVKACDYQARSFRHPRIEERRTLLLKHCSTPKAPKVFL